MKFLYLPLLFVLPVMCFAQSDKVLAGSQFTEAALIRALQPEAASGDQLGQKTRSIRITAAHEAPAKRASASMLITFETNSAELTPRAKQMLDTLARALQSDKLAEFRFSIEGHADPRGGEQFNLQLSQQRAEKVVSYLSENQNIDRKRLIPVGKGQTQLLNTSNPDAPENRRVTVKTIVD